jgi:hypothetical protein
LPFFSSHFCRFVRGGDLGRNFEPNQHRTEQQQVFCRAVAGRRQQGQLLVFHSLGPCRRIRPDQVCRFVACFVLKFATRLDPFSKLEQAKAAFLKKFKEKTGNNWEDRQDFVPKSGKYVHIMKVRFCDGRIACC